MSVVAVTFGLFGAWSTLAPLTKASVAPGKIVTATHHQAVQHLAGGVVVALHVGEGAAVAKGDPLVSLADGGLNTQLAIVTARKQQLIAKRARLQAELDDRDSVDFPGDLESAPSDFRTGERRIFTVRREIRRNTDAKFAMQVLRLGEQTGGIEAIGTTKRAELRSIETEIGSLARLHAKGYVDNVRLRSLERGRTRLQGEIVEQSMALAEIEAKTAALELERMRARASFESEIVDELHETQQLLLQTVEKHRAIREELDRLVLRAPMAGHVIGLDVHTVGGVVAAGAKLMDIVSTTADLDVEVRIDPTDIDRVSVGQTADVRLTAFKGADLPVVTGTVVHVSHDARHDARSGEPFFVGKIRIENHETFGALVPGMPVEVYITTGSRTFFQYLAKPVRVAFARALLEE